MAMESYNKEYMPKPVEKIYEKIDKAEKFYQNRKDTHKKAYEKLEKNLYNGDSLRYDLISDNNKRNELINKSIDEKVNVYREKAKEEYGISAENEYFSKKPKEELDDFILTIYTGKRKEELKSEIKDAIEKMPKYISEEFYQKNILMNKRFGQTHDKIIQKTLYGAIEGHVKEEDKNEIINYLMKDNIKNIVEPMYFQKKDLIKLLKIYNKGEKEITREKIIQEYGGPPHFLKSFHSSEGEKEKKYDKDTKTKPTEPKEKEDIQNEKGLKDTENIKELIKNGQIEPEKASEVISSGQVPEMGQAIQEMASQGELSEDFMNRFGQKQKETAQKQKEEFKEKIKNETPSAEQLYQYMKNNQILEQAVSEMANNGELSQDFAEEINRLGQEETKNFENQIKEGKITQEELQSAYHTPQKMNALFNLYSKDELPDELKKEIPDKLKEEFENILKEKSKGEEN